MDIKKTRILHRRYNAQGWATRRLRQGEIGVLLSNDGSQVLQVRLGMSDGVDGQGSLFSEGVLLGLAAQDLESTKQYSTRLNFPSIGSEFVCYIAKDTNTIYRWDDQAMTYFSCSSSQSSSSGQSGGLWHEINGGKANLYKSDGQLDLGTSQETDWWIPQILSPQQ